ncbi:MAG: acetate--CoA ligase family protein [Ectothiorhodospiraceae bacterium]|nr:acetate--CoA ligase family protein [Ectothiorhodospiraceae bacterium]
MAGQRKLYPASEMRRLFAPASIAIIGASRRPTSFAGRTLENLAEFRGNIYLVNPRYDEIDGVRCYPSVRDLPEAADCAVLVTNRDTVEGLLEECIEAGVGSVLVYASGFAEIGSEAGAETQRRIARRAREAGVALLGPNAIGFVNFGLRAGVTFLDGLDLHLGYERDPEERSIGLISQSGALGLSLSQAMQHGVFFSHVLATGNSSDIDVADCIGFLAEEPSCKVIACVLEGLVDPLRLELAAHKASLANKPLIVCKMAKGQIGASAAASHTGSLAGSHAAYKTMVERAGGIVVDRFEDILETAAFFAKAPPPRGDGVAVIATSGGAAIMAADAAEAAGVPLPQPDNEVAAVLKSHIPEFGSAKNPCDVTAEVVNNVESLTACVEAVLAQDAYGILVVPHPLAYATAYPRIELLDKLAGAAGKLICSVWLSGWLEGPGAAETAVKPNLALFRSMERCFQVIDAWQRWHRRALPEAEPVRLTPLAVAEATADALETAGDDALTERAAKALLEQYGVPVVGERRARSADEAVEAAAALGFPLVMKIDSPDLPHKTEAGGIALNLRDEEEVRGAYSDMMERISALESTPRINGVLLQRMVPKGVEIMVGARTDPAFGPLVVVGLGGVLVELLKDTVVAPAPVTPRQAERMLERLTGVALLRGFRDLPPVNIAALSAMVARISEFASDHRDRLRELDVNPLICRGDDIVAVDALIIPAGSVARLENAV